MIQRDFLSLIQQDMDTVEKKISSLMRSDSRIAEQLLKYTLSAKGKRLRPALVLLSGQTVGKIREAHADMAVAIELIHTATLVHDDIIDEATLRRQKTSLNRKYGSEMAVIFGDHLLAQAIVILAEQEDPAVLRRIAHVTRTICEGELFQTHRRFDFNLSRTDYLKMIEQKTASLFAVSCRLGGFLSGASPQEQSALQRYGMDLGIAFQIVDDCLDILGDEERVGKSLGTDLKKGKWTLPLIRLRESMKRRDWEEVRVLLFEDLEEIRMRKLVQYLTEHHAVDRVVEEARSRIAKAQSHLDVLPQGPATAALRQLADEVLSRNKAIFQKVATQSAVAHSA